MRSTWVHPASTAIGQLKWLSRHSLPKTATQMGSGALPNTKKAAKRGRGIFRLNVSDHFIFL